MKSNHEIANNSSNDLLNLIQNLKNDNASLEKLLNEEKNNIRYAIEQAS